MTGSVMKKPGVNDELDELDELDLSSPEALTTVVLAAVKGMRSIEDHMVDERKQRSRRIWFQYFLTACVLAVAVYAVLLVRASNSDRAERTRQSCIADASRAQTSIVGFGAHDLVEADKLVPLPRTPETQARVDDYLRSQHDKIASIFLIRNCTPQGIEDYFSTPQGPHAFLPPPPLSKVG